MLVPRKVFDLTTAADVENSRFAFGGVRFERDEAGQPWAVATDGRRLVAATWEEPAAGEYPPAVPEGDRRPGFGGILPVAAAKKAAKLAKPSAAALKRRPILQHVVLTEDGEPGGDGQPIAVRLGATDYDATETTEAKLLEGRFPRWREVVPAYGPANALTVCLDARYVAELAKLAGDLGGGKLTFALAADEPATRPVMLSAAEPGGVRVCAVLMPMNAENGKLQPNLAPAFGIHELPAEAEAEAEAEEPAEVEAEPVDDATDTITEAELDTVCEPQPAAEPQPATQPAAEPAAVERAAEPHDGPTTAMRAAGRSEPRQRRQPAAEPADWRENARRLAMAVNV